MPLAERGGAAGVPGPLADGRGPGLIAVAAFIGVGVALAGRYRPN